MRALILYYLVQAQAANGTGRPGVMRRPRPQSGPAGPGHHGAGAGAAGLPGVAARHAGRRAPMTRPVTIRSERRRGWN